MGVGFAMSYKVGDVVQFVVGHPFEGYAAKVVKHWPDGRVSVQPYTMAVGADDIEPFEESEDSEADCAVCEGTGVIDNRFQPPSSASA